jgi:hypothetical protein
MAFAADAAKQWQWQGFLRRTAIAVSPQPLPELLEKVAALIMPAARAAAERIGFIAKWYPGAGWMDGTTQQPAPEVRSFG